MLNPVELEKFEERAKAMIAKAKKLQGDYYNEKFFVVDLKERQQSRTIQQNAYLWVTITYVAIEEGYTKDYIEQEFKRVNKDVFLRERENKQGKTFQYWRHIPDLDKEEMSLCIDRWLIIALWKEDYTYRPHKTMLIWYGRRRWRGKQN